MNYSKPISRHLTQTASQSETKQWQANVLANNGLPTVPDVRSLNAWIRDLKNRGLWQKLYFLWSPPSGTDFAGSAIALKHPNANGKTTLTNFVAADLNVNGLVGNGSNKGMDCGFACNSFASTTGVTLGFYSHTNSTDSGLDIGTNYPSLGIITRFTGTTIYWDCVYSTRIQATNSDSLGLHMGTRLDSLDFRIYKNKTQLANGSAASGAMPSTNLQAWNISGGTGVSTRRLSLLFASGLGFAPHDRDSFNDSYAGYAFKIGRSLP